MSLTLRPLNPGASLNSFKTIGAIEFMPGEDIDAQLQIFSTVEGIRYVPPATAEVTLEFNKTDGTVLEVEADMNADDRSLISIEIDSADVEDLIGGNVPFTIDTLGDGTKLLKGIAFNILRKLTADCGC